MEEVEVRRRVGRIESVEKGIEPVVFGSGVVVDMHSVGKVYTPLTNELSIELGAGTVVGAFLPAFTEVGLSRKK